MTRSAALLPCLLLLCACRHPGAPAPRAVARSGAPAAHAASGTSRNLPPADGYFRWRLREDPPDLDPAEVSDTWSSAVALRVHDGLVAFDPVTMAVVPAVAASWTLSDDGRVYEFTLKDGVTFHSGRAVTADDVAYSFERTLRPSLNAERRWVLEPILGATAFETGKADHVKGIEVLDARRIRITLEEPYAPFLAQLTMEAASILPREVYDDPEQGYLRAPVGCGPFAFEEWQRGSHLRLKAYAAHHDGPPRLAGITFRIIPDQNTAVEEYLNGGLELADEVPPGRRITLRERLPGEALNWPQVGVYYYGFNHLLPPFAGNVKLRQAFNLAIDREYICRVIQEGRDTPAYGLIPPGVPGHRPEADQDPHDLERAKQLLAEAGYPGGQGLPPLVVWCNNQEAYLRVTQQVQSDLAKLGVTLELRTLDWAAYLDLIEATETENTQAAFFRMGWIADIPDPDNFLTVMLSRDFWGPKGNYTRYFNPELEQLIDAARTESDVARRMAMYQEAERIAMEDAAIMPVYFYGEEALVKPYVKGFLLSPQGDWAAPMEDVWLEAPAGS
jgi:peptide/nickel transport system substrate-binding protein/oligopeptide transport system substrate-binding protein